MRKLIILVTVITITLFLISCGGSTAPTTPTTPTTTAPPPATTTPAEPAASDAAKLFATNCSGCHGQNRQGVTGLAPALTPTSLAARTVDELKTAITKGKTGTAMPSFERLGSADIDTLVDFIKNTTP